MEVNNHPSQYQTPINSNYQYQSQVKNDNDLIIKNKNRTFGQVINLAFWLSLLFVALSNSYTFMDNVYYTFKGSKFQFIKEETFQPTAKGIIVSAMLFFVLTIWFLERK